MTENTRFFRGFLKRRQCVLPTWRGWLVVLLAFAIAATVAVRNVYDFLAMNAPLPDGILVVEGWGSDLFLLDVVKEFHEKHYTEIFVTGGPVDRGSFFTGYTTYAEMTVASLEKMGIDSALLHGVPSVAIPQDRTYASAIALKKWLKDHNLPVTKITLITMGTHSRRSHLLFEKAFGNDVRVGVIAVKDIDFDAEHWWRTSAGFRSVVDETVAYFYARFLFHAPRED